MRVFVYFNLHRQCLSVKALEGPAKGRVILHAAGLRLTHVQFKVSAAGRARVLRERRKNVHAGVVGTLAEHWPEGAACPVADGVRVTYDPYRYSSFVEAASEAPILAASGCFMVGRDVRVAGGSPNF